MKSNDDNLYAATLRQALKFGWGGKPKSSNCVQASRRRQDLKRRAPMQNPWALTGPDELR
jgi:hypothetical protein